MVCGWCVILCARCVPGIAMRVACVGMRGGCD